MFLGCSKDSLALSTTLLLVLSAIHSYVLSGHSDSCDAVEPAADASGSNMSGPNHRKENV